MFDRVLVTGAAGFIGEPLCRHLLSHGHPVRAAVRVADARSRRLASAGAEIVEIGDIAREPRWAAALKDVDAVIHAVGRAHVMTDTSVDPAEAYRTVNVDGSTGLARAMAERGVGRLTFVSSIKVNGEQTHGRPFRPEDAPTPEDHYGRSKLEAERALSEIARASGMSLAIVRPPLVYGPGVRANFGKLVSIVKRGVPLPFARIRNRRSLVAVGNLVPFLALTLEHDWDGRALLVSDEDDVSTPELCRRIGVAVNRPARLIPVPAWLLRFGASALGRGGVARRLCGSLVVDSASSWAAVNATPPITMADELERLAQHDS